MSRLDAFTALWREDETSPALQLTAGVETHPPTQQLSLGELPDDVDKVEVGGHYIILPTSTWPQESKAFLPLHRECTFSMDREGSNSKTGILTTVNHATKEKTEYDIRNHIVTVLEKKTLYDGEEGCSVVVGEMGCPMARVKLVRKLENFEHIAPPSSLADDKHIPVVQRYDFATENYIPMPKSCTSETDAPSSSATACSRELPKGGKLLEGWIPLRLTYRVNDPHVPVNSTASTITHTVLDPQRRILINEKAVDIEIRNKQKQEAGNLAAAEVQRNLKEQKERVESVAVNDAKSLSGKEAKGEAAVPAAELPNKDDPSNFYATDIKTKEASSFTQESDRGTEVSADAAPNDEDSNPTATAADQAGD